MDKIIKLFKQRYPQWSDEQLLQYVKELIGEIKE